MPAAADLRSALEALVRGRADTPQRELLRDALERGDVRIARAATIAGDANRSNFVTGDNNLILSVEGADAAAIERALARLFPARLRQLPADLPDFEGREAEIAGLVDALGQDGGPAAITAIGGMGGVGKTALAVHVAHKLVEAGRAPDGQLLVELGGTSDRPLSPAEAMSRVIQSFEPAARLPDDQGDVARLFRAVLDGRRTLVLLDNARDTDQVRPLLEWRPPGCLVIVTSRQALALPGLRSVPLDVLDEDKARALLRAIVGPERATDAELDAISARCGRLPLALRAAGTLLAVHPDWRPAEYVAALSDERERLRRLRVEGDARLDVGAALVLSLRRLADQDAALAARWTMLGIFPTSFDRAAAAAVWDVPLEAARDGLAMLVAQSLVLYDPERDRHRLHDLMRDVALGPEGASVVRGGRHLREATVRHAAHYHAVLGRANDLYLQGNEATAAGLALYDLEQQNIRAGHAWALANASSDKPGEGTGVLAHIRARLRRRPPDDRALRLAAYYPDAGAYVLDLRLHPRERIRWLEAAAAGCRRLGDRRREGNALGNLGAAYGDLGELRRAIEFYEQVLVVMREIGGRRGEGNALGNLGLAYAALDEPRRAVDLYEQHLAIAREIGDRRGEGRTLGNLGSTYADLGEPRRAIELFEQQLEITRGIGDRRGEGNALGNLGLAYAALGEPPRAIEFYEQVLVVMREIGDRRGEGRTLGNLGRAYAALGEPRRAIEFYEQALVVMREIGDPRGEGRTLFNSGLVLDELGDRVQAIARLRAALEIEEAIEDPTARQTRAKLAEWGVEGFG